MKLKELEQILHHRPSVSGNTFGVFALLIAAIVLSAAFLLLGTGLLIESWLGYRIFLNSVASGIGIVLDDEQRYVIALSLGLICLILAAIFAAVIMICRMVLRRNQFIIELEDWLLANISDLQKTAAKRKSAKK